MTNEKFKMKKLKIYWWFWGLAIPSLVFGFIFGFNSTIDIPVHDTYFVVSTWHISTFISLFLFTSGCGYLIQRIKFNPFLNAIHFLSTFLGLGLIVFPMFFIGMAAKPRKYYSNTDFDFLTHIQDLNNIITLGVYVLVFGVIIYFVNLGIAIFKNKT